jgi:pimeloyl-ACP methyl ester carboxylesterase
MQAGNSLPLNIAKLKSVFAINRPQEPKPPFPYTAEDVTFRNDKFNIELAGTLTTPAGKGPFPAVILITGSGAQNRNEELMGHKPFMVIADYLSRNGIAVLRFDDRGVGKSQGNPSTATSADLASDAEAAFIFLKNNQALNQKAIGLMGHSEGGLIAPIIAASNKEIAFIVSLAGPGLPGEQIIHRQAADISRASGINRKQIEENILISRKLFAELKKESDNNKASAKMLEVYKQILAKKKSSAEETEKSLKQIQSSLNPAGLTWLRYFLYTDPAKFWKEVSCPVLALNGSTDLQVAADDNLNAIEKALKSGGNKNYKTLKLEGLNHLFQHSETGLPAEYGNIEETFSPEALKIISDWILKL